MKELIKLGLKDGLVIGVMVVTATAVMSLLSVPGTILEVLAERKLKNIESKEIFKKE